MSNPPVGLRHLYDIIPKDLRQPYTQRYTPFNSCQQRCGAWSSLIRDHQTVAKSNSQIWSGQVALRQATTGNIHCAILRR